MTRTEMEPGKDVWNDNLAALWQPDSKPVWWILRLAYISQPSLCHDPRDLVYSNLGMVARLFPDVDISKFLRPDYSQAQEDLWVQVAMLASQHSLSLDFLIKPSKDPNIPTWVTNYQTRGCDSLALSFPKFNAGLCSSSTWPKHTTTTTTLTCYGAKYDVIQSALTLDMEGVDNFDFIRILNFLLSMKEDVDTRLDTPWRTMIWNCADAATKIPGNRVIAPASFQENFVAYMIGQTAIRWARCQSDED